MPIACHDDCHELTFFSLKQLFSFFQIKDLLVIGSSDYKKCKGNVQKVISPNICKEMNFTYCLEVVDLSLENKRFMVNIY